MVVALGVLFLLDSTDVIDADRVIGRWWPVVFVAAGLLTLAERPPGRVRGVVLIAVGAVLLLFTTDVLDESAWNYVWPVAVIVVGVVIVLRWSGHGVPVGVREEDVVRSTAVFSGAKVASSGRFAGAWLTAAFGGITLDLRDAHPPPTGASVNATVAFGGIDILVPHGWHVSVRSTPIFGGVEDSTEHETTPAADAPTLHVDAVCVFGGVGIKHHA